MKQRIACALFLVFTISWIVSLSTGVKSGLTQGQKAASASSKSPPVQMQGAAGCAASVCHGGSSLRETGSEFATWNALDPHARAYDALLLPLSRDMASRLKLTSPAHKEPLCLKCHVGPGYDHARPNFRKQDGVGCESCHGAAQHWLTPHYRTSTSWSEKQALGMADTKSLSGRVEICAGCHIGSPDSDVNHDLIAAGHPVLRFEFATYFANLPAHWNVDRDKKSNSTAGAKENDFEARAWAIGQLITSAKSLELLAHRAAPESKTPWPEFAEMDCFACHHDLQPNSWRQQPGHTQSRRPGSMTWNLWYRAMIPDVLAFASPRSDESSKTLLDLPAPPMIRDAKLSAQATNLARSLRKIGMAPIELHGLDRFHANRPADQSWDEATQRYFALMALRQLHIDNKQALPKNLDAQINALRKGVTFVDQYQSPRDFTPQRERIDLKK